MTRRSSIYAGSYRSCVNASGKPKSGYGSYRQAEKTSRLIRHGTGDMTHPYLCVGAHGCGRWHVGSDRYGDE